MSKATISASPYGTLVGPPGESNMSRMIKLDRGSKAPLYQQVKSGLQELIKAKGTSHDQPIPSERELAEMLKLSRLTVRRSIVELANEGFLRRIPGRGTFIIGGTRAPVANIGLVVGINSQAELGGTFLARLLSGAVPACRPGSLSLRTMPDLGELQGTQALIAMWVTDAVAMQGLVDLGLPVLAYECVPCSASRPFDTLDHANEEGAAAAVASLIVLGHRDIAFAMHHSSVARERQAGCLKAMAAHGLAIPPERIHQVMPSSEAGYAFGRQLLAEPERAPTAVVCSDDHIAHGLLEAAKDAGIQVPGFLSIIGFGDLGVFSTPALSSVHMDIHGSGRDAVRLLRERLVDPGMASRRHVLATEFIRRASCGPPRRS